MNLCIHTGWTPEAAVPYIRGNGEDVLFFTLMVRDPDTGEDVAHKMRVEQAAQIQAWQPLLTPGRQMTVHSKSKLVPIVRHGVVKAETVAFEVRTIEFHSRAGARPSDAAKEPQEPADVPAEAASAGGCHFARALEKISGGEQTTEVQQGVRPPPGRGAGRAAGGVSQDALPAA